MRRRESVRFIEDLEERVSRVCFEPRCCSANSIAEFTVEISTNQSDVCRATTIAGSLEVQFEHVVMPCGWSWELVQDSYLAFELEGADNLLCTALAKGELIGDSALNAAHYLYWMHIVRTDDGLKWIGKYSRKAQIDLVRMLAADAIDAAFHADRHQVWSQEAAENSAKARMALYTSIDAVVDPMRILGTAQRVRDDVEFKDAVRAVLMLKDQDAIVKFFSHYVRP